MDNKICIKCGIEKPINQYHKDSKSELGYRSVCIQCRKEEYRRNRIDHGMNVLNDKIVTEDGMECLHCHNVLPMSMFVSGIKTIRKYSYCSKCRNKMKDDAKVRSGKQKINHRRRMLKSKYGISMIDYSNMFSKQGGKCAICGNPPDDGHEHLNIDHDHKTGKVRGLLCMRCNTSIGKFEDSVELLEGAILYLKSNGGANLIE